MTGDIRILVTNDDGINAPGLASLERIARSITSDVWVVAPETEQSGASHSLTLHSPVRIRKLDTRRYAVAGTPTDCVVMAVKHVMETDGEGKPIDLVLSGVNRGSNMADDVTYSGTIAAAMEGTVLGIRSIALSQAFGFDPSHNGVRFETAEALGPAIVAKIVSTGWPRHVLFNINFPDVPADASPEIEVTRQGVRDQSNIFVERRVDTRGYAYHWIGMSKERSKPVPGTDLRAIYEGRVSVTPLHLNLTETEMLDIYARALATIAPTT